MRNAAIVAISAALLAIGGWVYAQQQLPEVQLRPFPNLPGQGNGTVIAGPDVGIRLEGTTEGRVIGTLVVRAKDGTWIPVQLGRSGVHKLDTN